MQLEHTKANRKRTYEKPKLRIIELVAEEVLGIGCKTWGSGSGVMGSPCGPGSPCSTINGS